MIIPFFIVKMINRDHIRNLIEERLSGSRLFLTDISVQPSNRIFVYIDGDTPVSIHDCQELSRYIESWLDRNKEDYDLTVSSAGLDSPLRLARQYPKNIGETLNIVTDGGENIRGRLVSADETGIGIEKEVRTGKKTMEKTQVNLTYDRIRSARIEVTFKKHENKP
jgi:ribosome maturation factor RimP